MDKAIVRCIECGEDHYVSEVGFLNVEEDISGRDKLYFVCPVTHKETWAFVI